MRTHVLGPLGMTSSGFLPPPAEWGECMPTAVPSGEGLSIVLQGRVNDGNACVRIAYMRACVRYSVVV